MNDGPFEPGRVVSRAMAEKLNELWADVQMLRTIRTIAPLDVLRDPTGVLFWYEPNLTDTVSLDQFVQVTKTTVAASISSGTQTVTPVSMQGVWVGINLTVVTGLTTEVVAVTAVTATTFTATFINSYTGPVTITGAMTGCYYPGVYALWSTPGCDFVPQIPVWVETPNGEIPTPGAYYLAKPATVLNGVPVFVTQEFYVPRADPVTIAANTNNLIVPVGTTSVQVTTTSASNLTGISMTGSQPVNGSTGMVKNLPGSSANLTLTNQDANSTAGNQFYTASGAPVTLTPGDTATWQFVQSLNNGAGGYLVTGTTSINVGSTPVVGANPGSTLIVGVGPNGTPVLTTSSGATAPNWPVTNLGTASSGSSGSGSVTVAKSVTVNAGDTLIVVLGIAPAGGIDFGIASVLFGAEPMQTANGAVSVLSPAGGSGFSATLACWFNAQTTQTATITATADDSTNGLVWTLQAYTVPGFTTMTVDSYLNASGTTAPPATGSAAATANPPDFLIFTAISAGSAYSAMAAPITDAGQDTTLGPDSNSLTWKVQTGFGQELTSTSPSETMTGGILTNWGCIIYAVYTTLGPIGEVPIYGNTPSGFTTGGDLISSPSTYFGFDVMGAGPISNPGTLYAGNMVSLYDTTDDDWQYIEPASGIMYVSCPLYNPAWNGTPLINQTGSQTVLTFTTPNDGTTHLWDVVLTIRVNSGVGTLIAKTTFTDENGTSRTQNIFPLGATSATINATGDYCFPHFSFAAEANTAVSVVLTLTGTLGYDVYPFIYFRR